MNKTTIAHKDDYIISTDTDIFDIEMIHQYLSEVSYWAKNIPSELVRKSMRYSLCFGVFEAGRQIGFARVITDRASFAYLGDVFILPAYRGRGLSKWLMQTIHAHPDLQGLRRWLLFTSDAHGLYRQFGWEQVPEHLTHRIMQIHHPDIYLPVAPQNNE